MIVAPPAGRYVQIYRGGVRGATPAAQRDQLARYCDELGRRGMPGVMFHGFPQELHAAWEGLAPLARDHGLLALASWGLDGQGLSSRRKGELVGEVLAQTSCAAGAADAEGQYDTSTGPSDDMNEGGALAFGEGVRSRAVGGELLADQPWFAIDSHGSLRRQALPIGEGGPFAGFPVDEFAAGGVNWFRFRQCYANEAGFKSRWGTARWEHVHAWMERDWSAITPALAGAGLERPLGLTLQAYGWEDVPDDLVAVLLEESCAGRPVVLWSEPWPSELVLTASAFVAWCEREHLAAVGVHPTVAACLAQEALNRAGGGLSVDGRIGEHSLEAWQRLVEGGSVP